MTRWIGFNIDLFSGLYLIGATLIAFFTVNKDASAASEMALALISSLAMLDNLQNLVKLFADIQSSMSSVQRMQAYAQLPQ